MYDIKTTYLNHIEDIELKQIFIMIAMTVSVALMPAQAQSLLKMFAADSALIEFSSTHIVAEPMTQTDAPATYEYTFRNTGVRKVKISRHRGDYQRLFEDENTTAIGIFTINIRRRATKGRVSPPSINNSSQFIKIINKFADRSPRNIPIKTIRGNTVIPNIGRNIVVKANFPPISPGKG